MHDRFIVIGVIEALTALSRALEARDRETRIHCDVVGSLSRAIAERLGLDPQVCVRVGRAGTLHDIGKVGLRDEILRKPGPLTFPERLEMQEHPAIGAHILLGAGLSQEALWVLHHHESYDGSGYPGRLAGEDIPIGSRIILVADAFDAMTSPRPYRPKGLSSAAAFDELEANAGTQFDPECVAALSIACESVLAR